MRDWNEEDGMLSIGAGNARQYGWTWGTSESEWETIVDHGEGGKSSPGVSSPGSGSTNFQHPIKCKRLSLWGHWTGKSENRVEMTMTTA